ncbi:hypothetical protein EW146_g8023 [Bondarzewia mesenterica]|uniref:Uncharacterized protein n=1 Tax=Bondarzewia mesenterica TaxID=1095465 RepID=A0A4S4LHS9_9AGAM|nr:hypothetical protein EW146_g8023 [Bondarzewia mesenterica]
MSTGLSSSLGVYILPEAECLMMANWVDWMPRVYTVCQVRGLEPYLLGTILPPSQNISPTAPSPTPIPAPAPAPVDVAPIAAAAPAAATPAAAATLALPMHLPTLPTGPTLLPSQASPYGVAPLSAFFPIYPPTASAGTSIPVMYAATDTEWRERDTLAHAHIILNVADIPGSGLNTAGSAADAWRSLRNRFELRDPIVVQDMRMRLASTWYIDGTVVTEHFKTLQMLCDTANRASAAISEGEFCQMALMMFPVDGILGTVVMTLLTCQDSMVAESVLSSQEAQIRASALHRANLPAVGNPSTVAGTALITTQCPQCSHCNKLGHPTDKCWADGGAAEHRRPECDSGATFHYFADRRDFITYEPLLQPAEGCAAGPGGFTVAGKGTVVKDTIVQGKRVMRTLRAIHAPNMGQNLLSTRQFDREGGRVWTEGGRTIVVDAAGRRFAEAIAHARLNSARTIDEVIALSASQGKAADIATWHHHFSHIGMQATQRAIKAVDGMAVKPRNTPDAVCEDCLAGCQTRRPFNEVVEHETEVGKHIHGDLMGPMPTASLGGKRYTFGLRDGCSAWATIAFLASKTAEETLAAVKTFSSWLETQTGRPICRVRTDNGTEKRRNCMWTEHARCMMHDGGVPTHLWAEVLTTAVYVRNIVPSARNPASSAWEVVFGRCPHVEHLRAYGSVAYAKVPDERRTKLDGKTVKCLLVGYHGRDSYCLYKLASGHVFVSRDIVFDEGLGHWSRPPVATVEGETVEVEGRAIGDSEGDAEALKDADAAPTGVNKTLEPQDPRQLPNLDLPDPHTLPKPATSLSLPPNAPRHSTHLMRSSRAAHETREYEAHKTQAHRVGDDWAADNLIANLASHDGPLADPDFADSVLAFIADTARVLPKTLEEAMEHPELWQEAIEKELTKMLFAEKFDADGKITGRKARLVRKGYSQRFGVNFLWTSAAVVRLETVQTALALAAIMDLELWQVDFESAFLNAPIDSDIYMYQPRGFEEPGKEDWVC